MDLTALVEEHSRRAAEEGPVTFALLQAMRYLQDGRNFVEGDFREWIAEGERLRGDNVPVDDFWERQLRTPAAPLTTGDDDRPLAATFSTPEHRSISVENGVATEHIAPPSTATALTPAQQRMAKARAAKAAKAGAA